MGLSMNAKHSTDDTEMQEPHLGSLKVRPLWSLVLFGLLAGSGLLWMWAESSAIASPILQRAAPWMFLLFACGFAAYRLALVLARRYSPFKAFFQIFLSVFFFLLLVWPKVIPGIEAPASNLLAHQESSVRAVAAELAGYRQDRQAIPRLIALLSDADAQVRQAAHGALVSLNHGVDLGTDAEQWKGSLK
jgi:HEAT repeats